MQQSALNYENKQYFEIKYVSARWLKFTTASTDNITGILFLLQTHWKTIYFIFYKN